MCTFSTVLVLLWLTYSPWMAIGSSLVMMTSDYYKASNVRLTAESTLKHRAVSLLECVASCRLTFNCFGVNYAKSGDVCEFLFGDVEFQEGPGTLENHHWRSVIIHQERVCVPLPTVVGPVIDCPEGYQHFNQKCYGMKKERKTPTEAASRCGYDQAELVSIESVQEQEWLCALICDSPDEYWTSGMKMSISDEYQWSSTGMEIDYTNWKFDLSSTELDDGWIFIDGTQPTCSWDIESSPTSTRYFICEYPQAPVNPPTK